MLLLWVVTILTHTHHDASYFQTRRECQREREIVCVCVRERERERESKRSSLNNHNNFSVGMCETQVRSGQEIDME